MKKPFIIIAVLSLVIAVHVSSLSAEMEMGHHHEMNQSLEIAPSGRLENDIRVIEVTAARYKFEPDPIVVRSGEKIRLVVASEDVTHGLAIPEFNVNLSVPAGKTESVEFVADKKGSFHAHCSVYCGPGHAHMHATFIVQ